MQQRRVLVVDDNEEICECLVEIIHDFGYEVWSAPSGIEAIRLAEEKKPHVVLVDLWMPGLTGYDVTRKLREMPGGRDVLVVAMTASEATVADSHLAGVDVHLRKPIEPGTLQRLFRFPDPG